MILHHNNMRLCDAESSHVERHGLMARERRFNLPSQVHFSRHFARSYLAFVDPVINSKIKTDIVYKRYQTLLLFTHRSMSEKVHGKRLLLNLAKLQRLRELQMQVL